MSLSISVIGDHAVFLASHCFLHFSDHENSPAIGWRMRWHKAMRGVTRASNAATSGQIENKPRRKHNPYRQ
jgi:hypothetical protein